MKSKLLAVLGGVLSLGFVGGAASAADMAVKAAPMPVPVAVYNWTGFYIGLNGGGGWSDKCWDLFNDGVVALNPTVPEGCHTASGGTVGGQIGYRWQSTNWVFGIEAQGNWANFTGSNVSLFAPFLGITNSSRVDALGLFTGQIGYAWNNTLLYVKGGAAVTRDRYEGVFAGIVIDRATETRWGGVLGAGVEFGFTPNWSFALEYDHLFMGRADNRFFAVVVAPGLFTRGDSIRQDIDMVTARINYKFGGPVVARY